MGFSFQFVYMLDHIDGLLYVEPSLHLCDEAYLIMVDDLFGVLLDFVCEYLIEYFYINVHEGNCLRFSFFVESLCSLSIRVTVAS